MSNKESQRKVIQFLAGGYLSYLAIQLFYDVFNVIEDTTYRIIFFLFATLFLIVGALFMFFVLRSEIKRIKNRNQEDPHTLEEHTETTDNEE